MTIYQVVDVRTGLPLSTRHNPLAVFGTPDDARTFLVDRAVENGVKISVRWDDEHIWPQLFPYRITEHDCPSGLVIVQVADLLEGARG